MSAEMPANILTREIVDDVFLYMSNLHAPPTTLALDCVYELDLLLPQLDLTSCLNLALVSRYFAQCWRRFQARYLLTAFEAMWRGQQLLTAFEVNYRFLEQTRSTEFCENIQPHVGAHWFDMVCKNNDARIYSNLVSQIGAPHNGFYNDRRCVLETIRSPRFTRMNHTPAARAWLLQMLMAIDVLMLHQHSDTIVDLSAVQLNNVIVARRIPSGDDVTGNQIPQRLVQLLSECGDVRPLPHFTQNTGIHNVFAALRHALTCRAVFDGQEKTLTLPAALFARADGKAVLRAMTYEMAESQHPVVLSAAITSLLESPAEHVRTLAFLLFRCAASATMQQPQSAHDGSANIAMALDMISRHAHHFHAVYGVSMSSTGVVSAADILLYMAQAPATDHHRFATRAGNAYRLLPLAMRNDSVMLNTWLRFKAHGRPARNVTFDARHPGAVAFAAHMKSAIRLLEATISRAWVTLTFPLAFGRIPTIRVLRHRNLRHAARLMIFDSHHKQPEHAPVAFSSIGDTHLGCFTPVPFRCRDRFPSKLVTVENWTYIGEWRAAEDEAAICGAPYAFFWHWGATTSFDIRLDGVESDNLGGIERYASDDGALYGETVLAALSAPSVPSRPQFIIEPLSERINYMIDHLASLVLAKESPAQFLESCTTTIVNCKHCDRVLAADEYATITCNSCAGEVVSLKRKAVPV